jgi:hypothetical protein
LKVNPIGIPPQPPSSKLPLDRGMLATPFSTRVLALEGTGVIATVIGVTVKLPALNPELIVAEVPGQTPVAEVVTIVEGKG